MGQNDHIIDDDEDGYHKHWHDYHDDHDNLAHNNRPSQLIISISENVFWSITSGCIVWYFDVLDGERIYFMEFYHTE